MAAAVLQDAMLVGRIVAFQDGLFSDLASILSEYHGEAFAHDEDKAIALLRALRADETTQFLSRYLSCRPGCLANELIDAAAQLGYMEAVEYMCGHGPPLSDFAIAGAARQGHLDVVSFLFHFGHPTPRSLQIALNHAAHAGQLGVVQFLYEHRLEELSIVPILCAANGGRRHVELYLRERYIAATLE
ncbi:unnamed protein product [Aphanomyces euteiches]|uniref:Ankyrin repeat protein n=1 Tax=Aphanomyces euteiches TaxID=100861 RepID=A0A6G0W4U7_9STRA|nr:hypothetical protein Ae201684_018672 [Aphanomyces euteiches]KAH9071843.1 hypothetical protein Ae201684P_020102 [Aphanomyces euteiches]KAH9153037.1 hypothetical protein AeRB84_004644 [Aphanomyces euteiches]